MNKRSFFWTILVVFASTAVAMADEQPQIIAQLERDRIYEGESVSYQVVLNHVTNPSPPDLSAFKKDFEVAPLGHRDMNSSSVTIVNGQMTKVVRRGRAYNYRLTPRRAGVIRVPAPVAMVDGRELRGRELTLRVVAPDDQDLVRMDIAVEPKSVYPTQPFTVTLSVAVKALPEPDADRSPVVPGRSGPPALFIPWVNDDELPDGLKPKVDWRSWLGPMQNPRGMGFSVNHLGRNSVFSLFEEQALAFCPKPLRVRRPDGDGRMTDYWEYQFSRTFVPEKIGKYTFGPATLKGMIATRVAGAYSMAGEQVYAVARPVTVDVKDVPAEGRPDSFLGAIGAFTWSAGLAPTKAKVGDPMTLTLVLKGTGSLDGAFAPDLARMSDVAEKFKMYEPTQEVKGNRCEFTYTLRPLEAGIEAFPAVPASYFDVETGKYVTLETEPIPLEISKADKLTRSQILAAPSGGSAISKEIETRREGLFANIADPAAVRDQSVCPGIWLIGLGSMACVYALIAVGTLRFRRVTEDKALVRRRGATAKARNRLREGLTALETNHIREGADQIQAALVGLVADVANIPEAGATTKDVCTQLKTFGLEPELIAQVSQSLETCDGARYGATAASVNGLQEEAPEVLERMIQSLKKQKRFR